MTAPLSDASEGREKEGGGEYCGGGGGRARGGRRKVCVRGGGGGGGGVERGTPAESVRRMGASGTRRSGRNNVRAFVEGLASAVHSTDSRNQSEDRVPYSFLLPQQLAT